MEELNAGDTAFILISAAMVLLMTPGLAFFYGGMTRAKSVLNMMMMSFIALGTVPVVWVLWGYSMAFGGEGAFIGGFHGLVRKRRQDIVIDGAALPVRNHLFLDGMLVLLGNVEGGLKALGKAVDLPFDPIHVEFGVERRPQGRGGFAADDQFIVLDEVQAGFGQHGADPDGIVDHQAVVQIILAVDLGQNRIITIIFLILALVFRFLSREQVELVECPYCGNEVELIDTEIETGEYDCPFCDSKVVMAAQG